MQPAGVEKVPDRRLLVAFTHPLAAAVVLLVACLVAWRGGSIGQPELDHFLRLLPFDSRFDARIGVAVAAAAALLVALFARGRAGRRFRRAIGVVGLAALAVGVGWFVRSNRYDCFRWEGCDYLHTPFLWVDAVLVALAAASLLILARHDPGPRARWLGAGAVAALAVASAAWAWRATPTLHRYAGADLAGVHLAGYFEANNDFVPDPAADADPADPERVPPAVPALPMQGAQMICAGDWRVVKFPDRDRCLPRRPLVTLQPGDVQAVTVSVEHVGAPPELAFTLASDAARRFTTALRTTGSFHFVLLTARGELLMDSASPYPVPGPTFNIKPGPNGATETERLVRLFLDRP